MSDWQGVVRQIDDADRPWIADRIIEWWADASIISRGQVLRPAELPGFIAEDGGHPVGLLTLHVTGGGCEVVTLNSVRPGLGLGGRLLDAAEAYARKQGCRRLWLITTNDNTQALRFYQRWGMVVVAWHYDALAASRLLKPQIPLLGADGIPIRDEIELAKDLF